MSSEVHLVWEDCAHWELGQEQTHQMPLAAHTRRAFDSELLILSQLLAAMGRRVEGQVSDAIQALTTGNGEAARKLVAADSAIDEMQRTIDQQVVETIAKRQPVAVDLREVLSISRIANDLERIGDLAKNIGKRTPAITVDHLTRVCMSEVTRMALAILRQLRDILDGFTHRDVSVAVNVWMRDVDIDRMCAIASRGLLLCMADDPDAVTFGVHLLFCTKNLERIGDHTTNIAEAVYYMVKGQALLGERPKADLTALAITRSRNPVRESTSVAVGNEPFDQLVEGAATAK